MSAVSNLTYVWFQDSSGSSPDKEGTPIAFSNYSEAMSFAKWSSIREFAGDIYASIWNYNGGSGHWYNGDWTPSPNTNWP